jgi:hypothetical protein
MFVLFQPRATRLKPWKPTSLPRATRRSKVVAEDHKEAKVVAEGHKEGKAKVVAEGHKERVPRGGLGRCRGLHGYLRHCQGLLGDQERHPGLHVGLWRSEVIAKVHKEAKVVAEGQGSALARARPQEGRRFL